MTSARTRVFETLELFEAILVQLPPRDLLLAQRISRGFQSVIQSSPKLQQSLFFRPESFEDPKIWRLNPLLRDLFFPWFVTAEYRWNLPGYDIFQLLDWNRDAKTKEAFLHPNASWRRMLLIQPPPKDLAIVSWAHGQGGDSASKATIPFADRESRGVTMDVLYDIPLEFLSTHTVSNFGMGITESDGVAPNLTLYLMFVEQCCGDEWKTPKFGSNAKETWSTSNLECVYTEEHETQDRRIDMKIKTDLTPERGGVLDYELEKWMTERAPISSLYSDVR
jgi:hypothetical protein